MEFTEKYTKKNVKGSTVVEMSYLIPFCLILFFLLITIIFYFHDKAILNAAAAETAVTGVEMDRKKIEDVDMDAFFQERTSGKLIFLENITTRVDLSGKKIEVEDSPDTTCNEGETRRKSQMEKIDFCKAEKVKGEENQMEEKKINQQSRVAESEIIIDSAQPYRENYQMRMIKNNRIPGLLRVSGCGMEGASRYYYHTGHSQSLETYYKNKDIKAEEILKLTRQFLSVMEKMKDYMLEPNYLMLSEKYIFEKDENYFFCFFPENEKTWQVSYHELTEYFVRKVDYQDLESIQLACMLHKETLKETYDIESILQQYEEEAKNRKEKSKEEKIREESKREKDRIEMEENQNIEVQENSYYSKSGGNYAVMEEKRYGPIKKFAKRFKSGKWGEWEDLITEADDYE